MYTDLKNEGNSICDMTETSRMTQILATNMLPCLLFLIGFIVSKLDGANEGTKI